MVAGNQSHGKSNAVSALDAMSTDRVGISDLIRSIYDGVSDESPCAAAVSQLRTYLNASWVALMLRPATMHRSALVTMSGASVSLPSESPYLNVNDIPPGGVFKEIDEQGVRVVDASGLGGSQHVIGGDIVVAPPFRIRLRIGRAHRLPAFTSGEIALVDSLLTHFGRAFKALDESSPLGMEVRALRGAVDRIGLGVLILDETGKVLHANTYAQGVLAERSLLGLSQGRPCCLNKSDDKKLIAALKVAQTRRPERVKPPAIAVCTGNKECENWLSMLVCSLPSAPVPNGYRTGAAAIYIRRSDQRYDISSEMIRDVFRLTPMEGRIALRMADGLTLDEAAASLGIRRNTGRTHLRSIFAKTGVRRQAQLVRVMLNSVALMSRF